MWKPVTLVCVGVLGLSPTAAAKDGWRPGLSLAVHVSIEMQMRAAGSPERASAELRYRLTTARDGAGFRVSIEDADLVSADGEPGLKRRILRDAAFLRSNPAFRVRKSGDFDGSVGADATLEKLRAAFAADPLLAGSENPTVVRRDVLDLWLGQYWNALRMVPRPVGRFEMPLADGFVAKGRLTESRAFPTTCPGSGMKCRKHVRVIRIDDAETRQHVEGVARAAGAPHVSLRSYVEEIRSEAYVGEDGVVVSVQSTEEIRMDMAVGTHHRETVGVTTSHATFAR